MNYFAVAQLAEQLLPMVRIQSLVIFYIEHICCRQRLKRQKEVGNGPLFKLLEDKAFSATALGLIWRLHHEFVLRLKIIVSVH